MTDFVTCRVCGFGSPLGTVECPECGAPLPTKVEAPAQPVPAAEPPSPAAQPPADETAVDAPAEKKPFKFRPAHLVAGLLAVCLLIPLVLLALPKKGSLPGAMFAEGSRLVTQDGVWDVAAAGLMYVTATSDGRYFLLEKRGDGAASDVKYRGVLSSTSLSYAYAPTGEYYLFDGRTLEPLEGENMNLTDNGRLFYTQSDDNGVTIFRRDLDRGKTTRIDRFEGEGDLDDFRCAVDGDALAYRWGGEDSPYRLWRQGTAKPVELTGIPGGHMAGVGKGGRACLFWDNGVNDLGYSDFYSLRSNIRVWRDGELMDLPDMLYMWCNADYTQFLLRENTDDYSGDWYYYAPGETDQPISIENASAADYLYPVSKWMDAPSLKNCFYNVYSSGNGDKFCYLTDDLTFLTVAEGAETYHAAEDGKTLLYLKDGGLYRVTVDSSGTPETTALTGAAEESGSGEGAVYSFVASMDLKHIYYWRRGRAFSREVTLHYWHNGVDKTLDFTVDTTYGNGSGTVTDDGAYYFTYTRDLYYTEKGGPPQLLLEEVGTNAEVCLVGTEQWPLLSGNRWEDSQNKSVYWLLDGNKLPIELGEWEPKEGAL